jgi:hypothetical protein
MGRLNPQFLPADDFPERGMPDMAFTSSAFPEPQDQPASIHPATKHLHDTGFGPLNEYGDEPVKSEWRLWLFVAALCSVWVWCATKVYFWIFPQ